MRVRFFLNVYLAKNDKNGLRPLLLLVAQTICPVDLKTHFQSHVKNTSHIGNFAIISQKTDSQAVQRIHAVTGDEAKMALLQSGLVMEKHAKVEMALSHMNLKTKYQDYRTAIQLIKNIRYILHTQTVPLSTRLFLDVELESLERKIKRHMKEYHKHVFAEKFNKEWLKLEEEQNKFIVAEINTEGSEAEILKALKSRIATKPIFAIIKTEKDNNYTCAAWVPESRQSQMFAEDWINTCQDLLQDPSFPSAHNPRFFCFMNGTINSTDRVIESAMQFASNKLSLNF